MCLGVSERWLRVLKNRPNANGVNIRQHFEAPPFLWRALSDWEQLVAKHDVVAAAVTAI
jgi:hypothetical protein